MNKTSQKGQKKEKKFFFKVKKEFLLPPPEKISRKKFAGVILIVFGLIILSGVFIFNYLIPQNFSYPNYLSSLFEKKEFVPKRVLIPALGINLFLENNTLKKTEIFPTANLEEFKPGKEMIIFSDKEYLLYKITSIKFEQGLHEQSFFFSYPKVKITFLIDPKLSQAIIIEAEKTP